MKSILTIVITLAGIMLMNVCMACDFCGCYMGITPYDNQSSISLLYRYKSYNGYSIVHQQHMLFPARSMSANGSLSSPQNAGAYTMKHGSAASTVSYLQKDYEIYTNAEIRARYYIHKRMELNVIIPFVMNSSSLNSERQEVHSLGDMTVLASWRVIDRSLNAKFQSRFIAGGGIKLPTGSFTEKSEDGDRVDPMLQSGTGTIDYLMYLNYILSYKKIGINLNSTYKMNGTNHFHEKVGNSSTNYVNLFIKLREEKKLKIFPSLQGFYEYTNGFFIDNKYVNGTTVNCLMGGAGLDVYYKNVSINTSFQLPMYEDILQSDLACAGRLMIGLTYSFNQNKYLIHRKQ